MKKIIWIVVAIILAGLIAAGSFWGGMQYQSAQMDRNRANFMSARGLQDNGQLPGEALPQGMDPAAGGRPGGAPTGFGGGATGWVKSIDGNVLTISTAQDVKTVQLSETTRIQSTASGTTADLQPGTRVMISGQEDSDGQLTADQIMIMPADSGPAAPPAAAYPAPAGQEP